MWASAEDGAPVKAQRSAARWWKSPNSLGHMIYLLVDSRE